MNKEKLKSRIKGAVSMTDNCEIGTFRYTEETLYSYTDSTLGSENEYRSQDTLVTRLIVFLTVPNQDLDTPLESEDQYEILQEKIDFRPHVKNDCVYVEDKNYLRDDTDSYPALVLEDVSV